MLCSFISRSLCFVLFLIFVVFTYQFSTAQNAGSLNFSGPEQLHINDISGFNTSAYTIECMVYIPSSGGYKPIFHFGNPANSDLEIYARNVTGPNPDVAIVHNRVNSGTMQVFTVGSLPLDQWILLTVSFSETDGFDAFYDGVLAPVTAGVAATGAPVISPASIGYVGTMPVNGWGQCCAPEGLDELRVWDYKLSQSEINDRLNCELIGTEVGLWMYHSFNQGIDSGDNTGLITAIDQTGNGHDADLISFNLIGNTSNWVANSPLITGACIPLIEGCTDASACNFDPTATADDGSCLSIGMACDDGMFCTENDQIQSNCNCVGTPINVDDGIDCTIDYCDEAMTAIIHIQDPCLCDDGDPCTDDYYDPILGCLNTPLPDTDGDGVCDAQEVAGCTNNAANNYDPNATDDDGSCDFTNYFGCIDPAACNYNDTMTMDDGSCMYPSGCDFCSGETDGSGVIMDGDSDNDGICNIDEIPGCTDAAACNYSETATDEDGSCEYTSCLGCTDPTACEFDPTALIDDGSCLTYPGDACNDGIPLTENDQIQVNCDCIGTPIDSDNDGISDLDEINFWGTDPNVQDTDGDGLTDGLEINISFTNPLEVDSDGDGCTDDLEFSNQCGAGACPGDLNGDGQINAADLLSFLGVFGNSCD